jgi:primary-amine oxidase
MPPLFTITDPQPLNTDFPVMPVEKLACTLKPANFFDLNPSNDVPRSNQEQNKSTQVAHGGGSCCEPRL